MTARLLGKWLLPASVLVLILFSAIALGRRLWFDELLTYHVSRLDGLGALWNALTAGFDLNPPLYYLLAHASMRLPFPVEFTLRLPAMIGFLTLMISAGLYFRKSPVAVGVFVFLFAVANPPAAYAFEARGYALELGAAGIALLGWQLISGVDLKNSSRILGLLSLWIGISGVLLSHVWGVVFVAALGCGELARWWERRRPDWTVAAVFALACWPLIMYPSLAAPARALTLSNPVYAPTLYRLAATYYWLVKGFGRPIFWIALTLAVFAFLDRKTLRPSSFIRRIRLPEIVFMAASVVMLPIAWFAAWAGHSAYMARYGIGVFPAVLIAVGWSAHLILEHRPRVIWAMSALTALLAIAGFALTLLQSPGIPSGTPAADRAYFDSGLPVVFDSLGFLEANYYHSPRDRARIYFLAEPAIAIRRTGTNGADRPMLSMRRIISLDAQIVDYQPFLDRHRRFFVHSGGEDPMVWLLPELRDRGAIVKRLSESWHEVQLPEEIFHSRP